MLKVIDTHALINSGADISCIDWQFVRKHSLPTIKLDIPIKVQNIDQTSNKNREICFTCTLFTNIEGIAQKHHFHIMSCGRENIILGLLLCEAYKESLLLDLWWLGNTHEETDIWHIIVQRDSKG